MNETLVTAVSGIIVLAINCVTMFLTFDTRRGQRFSIFALTLFTAAVLALAFCAKTMGISYPPVLGLFYLPIIVALFKGVVYHKIFAFFFLFNMTVFQIALATSVLSLFLPENTDSYYIALLITLLMMYAGYVFSVFRYGRRLFSKLFIDGRRTEWILYAAGAIFAYSVITMLRIISVNIWLNLFLLLFVLWSFGVLCFAIVRTHEKSKQQYDAELAQSIVSSGRDHYRKMNAMYEKIRMLRHDYKYHLSAALKMLHSGDAQSADEYLTGLEALLEGFEVKKYCRNSVINALVAGYAERCGRAEVKLGVCIDIPEAMSIPNYDLCIIIGSLLENAVEACEKTDTDRFINLETRKTSTHLLLMVQNNFNGAISLDDGTSESAERPVSTKTNGGIGIKSVREVVSRNGGTLTFEWDEAAFSAFVSVKM